MGSLGFSRRAGRVLALAGVSLLSACANPAAPVDPGYVGPAILFSPIDDTSVYLMAPDGQKLHQWNTTFAPGYSVYLLPNGDLLRATSLPERPFSSLLGSNGGRVQMLDWDSRVVWQFDYATTEGQQHHDVFYMPGTGHVLMVAWERHSEEEALAAGRAAGTFDEAHELWVDKVVEVDPATSRIVWEWRTWDHLLPPGAAPSDHPELIDLNYVQVSGRDWTHANAVTYNPALDQVIISVRNFSEFWVIDHSTSTAEAAGHTGGRLGRGGDLVYRWGNPSAYGVGAPQQIFGQHNPNWIPAGLPGAGNILLFDNGDVNARPFSTVVEIAPPLQADGSYAYDAETGFGPAAPVFRYVADPPSSFFAPIISGAQRLPGGNTFITDGPAGRFFEVTPSGQTVWSYTVTDAAGGTGYLVFRAVRYEAGYMGLSGRTLRPEGPVRIPVPATARATRVRY
jgi:hypothetical protein